MDISDRMMHNILGFYNIKKNFRKCSTFFAILRQLYLKKSCIWSDFTLCVSLKLRLEISLS